MRRNQNAVDPMEAEVGCQGVGCRRHVVVAVVVVAFRDCVQALSHSPAAVVLGYTVPRIVEVEDHDVDIHIAEPVVVGSRNWLEAKVGPEADRHDILAGVMV